MSRNESTVEFAVTLPRKAADVIAEKWGPQNPGTSTPALLGRIARGNLNYLAAGGMMLDPMSAKRIEEVLPNAEPSDIADAMEKFKDRRHGQASYTLEIDPAFLGPLEEVARSQGLEMRQTIQEAVNYIFAQGWLYALPQDIFATRFMPEDYEMIRQIMVVDHFTGTDLSEWIRQKFVMGSEETLPPASMAAALPPPEQEEESIFQGAQ